MTAASCARHGRFGAGAPKFVRYSICAPWAQPAPLRSCEPSTCACWRPARNLRSRSPPACASCWSFSTPCSGIKPLGLPRSQLCRAQRPRLYLPPAAAARSSFAVLSVQLDFGDSRYSPASRFSRDRGSSLSTEAWHARARQADRSTSAAASTKRYDRDQNEIAGRRERSLGASTYPPTVPAPQTSQIQSALRRERVRLVSPTRSPASF